jgi:hypothetical protein
MSKQAMEAIIGRAVTDGAFRNALFARPDVALAGYDLTEGETASLKAIDFETMDSFAGVLDERVSKATALGLLSAVSGQASAASQAAHSAASLSAQQMAALSAEQLSHMSAQQMAALSAEQLSHMSAQQMAALSAEQLSHMSAQQLAALSAEQASSLSAQQLAQLSAQQLAVVLSKLPGTVV